MSLSVLKLFENSQSVMRTNHLRACDGSQRGSLLRVAPGVLWGSTGRCAGWDSLIRCRRALWLAVTWFDMFFWWFFFFPLEWGSGRLKWLTILVFYVSRIGIVLSWFSLTTTVGYQWGGDRFVATVWGKKCPDCTELHSSKTSLLPWQLYIVCHLCSESGF